MYFPNPIILYSKQRRRTFLDFPSYHL